MAYAVSSMVQRVRRILQDFPLETTLGAGYTAGGTTITVADGTLWSAGDVLEDIAGPLYLVSNVGGNNLTVVPNYDGTTSANMSNGGRVFKNPVFRYQGIRDKVDATIVSVWPWAWTTQSYTVTAPNPSSTWCDLSSVAVDLVSVRQLYGSNPSRLGDYGSDGGRSVVFMRNLPPTLVASGVGIQFPNGLYDSANSIYVVARRLLTADVATNNYSDLSGGIDVETIAYGAAAKLVADKEVIRVTQEDVRQGDASVIPLRRLQTSAFYDQEFRRRLHDWNAFLMQTVPPAARWA